MSETSQHDTVRVIGTGSYDQVDCGAFRVAGTATVTGDLFAETASVDGAATVGGRVHAGDVDADGTFDVDGDVRAESVAVDGSASVGGDLDAERLDADGTTKVGGDASVDDFAADGSTTVGGNLDGQEIDGDGSTTVEGSVVAATATFDGSVTVEGTTDVTDLAVDGVGRFGDVNADAFTAEGSLHARDVSAGTFELALQGDSEAASVAGTDVTVRRAEGSSSLLGKFLNRGDPVFEVDAVRGETVDLDATCAETVVGEAVRLGPDADVGVVYADDLDAHGDARVGDVRDYEARPQ